MVFNRSLEAPVSQGALPPLSASAATRASVSLSGIYEISKNLAEPARLEITLANVVNILSSFMQMRRGTIVVLDAQGEPEITAMAGAYQTSGPGGHCPVPQKAIDQIVATEMPLVIQDVSKSPLFSAAGHEEEPPLAFIGVPVKAEHKVVGTLSIERPRDGGQDFRYDEDVRFLTMVGNLVGQRIRLHKILSDDRQRLFDEQRRLEKALTDKPGKTPPAPVKIGGIVGESPAVKSVLETIRIVAGTNSTVLLRGESGTGKELFSQVIHDLSPRRKKPFIKLNCAALPESVLESELFGHEKGAFTGAIAQRAGRFELADGGTLLLDEIGEISPAFQAKLLRVLQEGEFERVGGNKSIKVDVRLICATNKDLETAVQKGEFRADLYYRINVVPIILPPLRERAGDIARLASAFLERFNQENQRRLSFSKDALDLIAHCYFPGNVRELENCVQRTATLARAPVIDSSSFACSNGQCLSALLWKSPSGPNTRGNDIDHLASGHLVSPGTAVKPAPQPPNAAAHGSAENGASRLTERDRLIEAMEKSGWVQAKAARLLGLTPRQIGYALRRHDVPVKKF